jgi:hypothetical protein
MTNEPVKPLTVPRDKGKVAVPPGATAAGCAPLATAMVKRFGGAAAAGRSIRRSL